MIPRYYVAMADHGEFLTKGNVYKNDQDGRFTFDSGWVTSPYESFDSFKACNRGMGHILVDIEELIENANGKMTNDDVANHYIITGFKPNSNWGDHFKIGDIIYKSPEFQVYRNGETTLLQTSGRIYADGTISGFYGMMVTPIPELSGLGTCKQIVERLAEYKSECKDDKLVSSYDAVIEMLNNGTINVNSVGIA